MKKILIVLLVTVLIAGSESAQAQNSDKAYLLTSTAIRSDNGAVRATRDLWKRIGDQKNEAWYKLPTGYLATFKEGAVDSRFVYDARGRWIYTMLTYTEKEMPRDVRKSVKSIYFDYSIGWVKEVRQDEDVVYVVHVEDAKEWMDLSVQPDGHIDILKAVRKQ
ncbi:MAG: hypothetical protein JST68_10850 [Bacteroidetes bacterium]|nr:hypothetical protein [Bacteroidota bacterium]